MSRHRILPYLFVYGSLRPGNPHPMARWLARRSRSLGRAWIAGRLYALPGYPALVDAEAPDARVWGELLALDRPRALLAKLDRYEQAGPGFPNPEFRRVLRAVQVEGRVEVTAWVYLYARSASRLRPLASGEWCPARTGKLRRGGRFFLKHLPSRPEGSAIIRSPWCNMRARRLSDSPAATPPAAPGPACAWSAPCAGRRTARWGR